MSATQFSRLTEIPIREAWQHEALDFTPWLADNISHLSEAIGIELEITGTEVAVESFSADILARNPMDDTVVLIENQLATTDHTHLGQIMTYLAGLDAQSVVWIAPMFREPHLSAIRWLNEHTADDFSFFAVVARVVRIGDSPLAPIFEVVEKPNNWDREIKQKAASDGAAYYDVKAKFWRAMADRHPDLVEMGFRVWRYSNNYVIVHRNPEVDISAWIGKSKCGVFVRSAWGEPAEEVEALLAPHRSALESQLGTSLGPKGRSGHFLGADLNKGHSNEKEWPEIMDWIRTTVLLYRDALTSALR